jgi:hypothetical protein
MNTQSEAPATTHRSVRRWIYLRGLLIGLLVAAWWILFAPDSLMEHDLKIVLGIIAGLIGAGSYLFNLRKALVPPRKD